MEHAPRGAADSTPGTCSDRPPAPQSTKAVYDRILDLRIATPQIVINYAMFLEEHKYFEESFKVRGPRTALSPTQAAITADWEA